MVACNPTAKLPSIQTQADAAFEQADYSKAHVLYSEYISLAKTNNVEVSKDLLIKQAQACGQLDLIDEAAEIYNMLLKDEANIKLIAEYAQMLQSNEKVDEELVLWNTKKEQIKEIELTKLATERLIFLNQSKENYNAILLLFESKGDVKLSKEASMVNIKALEATNKSHPAAIACNDLLKEYPDYAEALEWKASYYYNKAEKKYQYEMAKYNKKKNATTYAYLRRDLKKVSADFRISRDTFLKLRKQDDANKSYIRHLKNIYLRLDQKAEAAKMDALLK